jgi:hypothetical protein
MLSRQSLLSLCVAAVGLLVATTTVSATLANRLEHLTFRIPVALPGVTLHPGAYTFELANPDSGDIVRVRNRVTNHVEFLGFTRRVDLPRDGRVKRPVVLGEARPGEAAPILAWYPLDATRGYQFIYPDSTR